jgi:hypothetical protein
MQRPSEAVFFLNHGAAGGFYALPRLRRSGLIVASDFFSRRTKRTY